MKPAILAIALLLTGSLVAFAEDAPPKIEPGVGPQGSCIHEGGGFQRRGEQPYYVIALENKCEERITCKVFFTSSTAKGNSQGKGTITLAGKSGGAKAKGEYAVKVKMPGGMAQSTRECRAL